MELVKQIKELNKQLACEYGVANNRANIAEENQEVLKSVMDEKDEQIKKLLIQLAQKENQVSGLHSDLDQNINGLKSKLLNREKRITQLEGLIDQTKINNVQGLKNEIIKMEHVIMLQNIEIKELKEKYTLKQRQNDKDFVKEWINLYTGACDTLTPFKTLYADFTEWCIGVSIRERNNIPEMMVFKTELKKWQEKSEWGLNYGKRKDQAGPNGYETNMLFNLKSLI